MPASGAARLHPRRTATDMTDRHQRSRVRRVALRIVFSAFLTVLLSALLEVAARVLWVDQYGLGSGRATVTVLQQRKQTRMHPPRLDMTMRADGIYEGAGAVRFRTDARSALVAGGSPAPGSGGQPVWIALGGSTTECALVPEGQRWPDRLPEPVANFGVSGNTSMHSLRNLVALLPLGPRRVYVMHAYNDVLALTRQGEQLDLSAYEGGDLDLYASERPRGWLGGSRLLGFLTHLRGELLGRYYLDHYRGFVASQSAKAWLDDRAFEQLLAIAQDALLRQRGEILAEMARLSVAARFELVVVTQPHAYSAARLDGPDLRTSFVWRGCKLRFLHCARLLDAVNEHTREVCRRLGVMVVDAAGAFAGRDQGPLFYDQVHYTPAGCRALAELLR